MPGLGPTLTQRRRQHSRSQDPDPHLCSSTQPHAEAPPRVEYGLTGLGQSLVDGPMKALGRWTIEHGDELLDAQENAARAPSTHG
jgi:hypothetical protein